MKQIEIEKRVKKLAEHANGPLGRIPLERVFERHISFLEELRQFGATWGQIAQLLFTHGVTQKSGNILHANQVRVAFTRAQEKSKAEPKKADIVSITRKHDIEVTTMPNPPSEAGKSLSAQIQMTPTTSSKFDDLRRTMSQAAKARRNGEEIKE